MTVAHDAAPRMSLDFLFGRGFLAMRGHRPLDWLTVDDLRMEIPDVSFPFDVRGGIGRFRGVRCQLRRLRLTVSAAALAETIAAAASDVRGFEDVDVWMSSGALQLSARVNLLSSRGIVGCRLAAVPADISDPGLVRLTAYDYVALGNLPYPAPTLVGQLLNALAESRLFDPPLPGAGPKVEGDTLVLPIARLTAAGLFLPYGWKMPGTESITVDAVTIRPGSLVVSGSSDADLADAFGAQPELGSGTPNTEALTAFEMKNIAAEAEAAMLRGDLVEAADRFRDGVRDYGGHRTLEARLLDVLLCMGTSASLAEADAIATRRVESDPEDRIGLQAHARLGAIRGDTDALIRSTRRLAEALRARRRIREQILCLLHLAEALVDIAPDEASRWVDEALKLAPRSAAALRVQAELARRSADVPRLEDALKRLAPLSRTGEERLKTYLELAELVSERRRDFGAARMYLDRARELAPEDPRIYADLARCLRQERRFLDAVRTFGQAARLFGRGRPADAARMHLDAARIWLERLDDAENAAVEVRRALELDPDAPDALEVSIELAQRLGRWDDALRDVNRLVPALERQLERDPSPSNRERLTRALRAAARIEERRGRGDGAVMLRERVVRLDPADAEAVTALERHYRQMGQPGALVSLYRSRLEAASGGAESAHLHRGLAELLAQMPGHEGEATRHFEDALEADADDAQTLAGYIEFMTRDRRTDELLDQLERIADLASREGRAAILVEIASAAWESGDAERARAAVEQALALNPGDERVLRSAVRVLDGGSWTDAATRLAERTSDREEARALFVRLAEESRNRDEKSHADTWLGRARAIRDDDTLRAAATALEASPAPASDAGSSSAAESQNDAVEPLASAKATAEGSAVSDTLDRHLNEARAVGDLERVADLLADKAAAQDNPSDRARNLSELGQLLHHDLEDAERARGYLEEARRIDPTGEGQTYELLSTLEAVYDELGLADGLVEVYQRRIDGAQNDEMRAVYRLLLASTLWEQLGRPEDALAALEPLLQTDPRNIPARRLRAEILDALSRFEDAARELRTLVETPEIDPFERQDVLRALGRLEWNELGELVTATSRYEQLLDEIPGDTESLSALKQIHGQAGDWDAYLSVLGRELGILAGQPEAFGDPAAVAEVDVDAIPADLRLTFARIVVEAIDILVTHRPDDGAIGALIRLASTLAPDEAFVLEARIRRARARGLDLELAESLVELAPMLLMPDARQRSFAEAIEAFERAGVPDRAQAIRGLVSGEDAEATQQEPSLPEVKQQPTDPLDVIDQAIETGDFAGALSRIDALLPESRQPSRRRALLVRKGAAILGAGDTPRDALLALKGALILDDDAPDTRFQLFRYYLVAGSDARAEEQLRELLALYPEDPEETGDDRLPTVAALARIVTALGHGADDARLERVLRTIVEARPWLADRIRASRN